MQGDELIHYKDLSHDQGEPNKPDGSAPEGHDGYPGCWCQPSRFRENALTGMREYWDRDNYEWVPVEQLPGAKVVNETPVVEGPAMKAPQIGASLHNTRDELIEAEENRVERDHWKAVD